ncbi:MAG TPA: hypothetical protein VGK67_16020 [Myxococcales bacterium]
MDSECVWLDDAWLNRDDLVRKIRAMMDTQNFEIARPSHALEALTKALASARLLALRISPEMSDALNAAAQQNGRPVGAVAREAIAAWLAGAATTQPGVPAPAAAAQPVAPAATPAPAAAAAAAAPAEAAATFIGPPPTGITTEAATPEEAENAVALTPKRKDAPPTQSQEIEKRWFDK